MPYNEEWIRVLLQNGTFGFVLSAKISVLPYRVSSSPISLTPPADVSNRALRLVGQPIDRKLRGGGFISKVFGDALPESLAKQAETGQPVTRLENLKPGDRVYFWDDDKGKMGFGGIFVGNGYFVGPLPGHQSIATDYLGKKKWLKSLVAARR